MQLKQKKNPKGNRLHRLKSFECFVHPKSKYKLVQCSWCKWQWCPLCYMNCPVCKWGVDIHPVLGKLEYRRGFGKADYRSWWRR